MTTLETDINVIEWIKLPCSTVSFVASGKVGEKVGNRLPFII